MAEAQPVRDSQELLAELKSQIAKGELQEALETLKIFSQQNSYHSESRSTYNEIRLSIKLEKEVHDLIKQGQYEKAIDKMDELDKIMPHCIRLRLLRIETLMISRGTAYDAEMLHMQLGDCEEWLKDEEKITNIYLRALIQYYNADLEPALQILGELFEVNPTHAKGRDLEKKLQLIKSALAGAHAHYVSGEYEKSMKCLREGSEVDPNNKAVIRLILDNQSKVNLKIANTRNLLFPFQPNKPAAVKPGATEEEDKPGDHSHLVGSSAYFLPRANEAHNLKVIRMLDSIASDLARSSAAEPACQSVSSPASPIVSSPASPIVSSPASPSVSAPASPSDAEPAIPSVIEVLSPMSVRIPPSLSATQLPSFDLPPVPTLDVYPLQFTITGESLASSLETILGSSVESTLSSSVEFALSSRVEKSLTINVEEMFDSRAVERPSIDTDEMFELRAWPSSSALAPARPCSPVQPDVRTAETLGSTAEMLGLTAKTLGSSAFERSILSPTKRRRTHSGRRKLEEMSSASAAFSRAPRSPSSILDRPVQFTSSPPRSQPGSSQAPPVALPKPELDPRIQLQTYQKVLNDMMSMNPHQILGLTPSPNLTVPVVIRTARQLIKKYHPDNNRQDPQLQICCVKIFQCIKDAEKQLIDLMAGGSTT